LIDCTPRDRSERKKVVERLAAKEVPVFFDPFDIEQSRLLQAVQVDDPVTKSGDDGWLAADRPSDPIGLDLHQGARDTCAVWRAHLLQIAPPGLLAFDRLEERLEVPLTEARRTLALDDLGEEGRAVRKVLGEDLQEVATSVDVDEDAEAL
jgi:hypothetical protein